MPRTTRFIGVVAVLAVGAAVACAGSAAAAVSGMTLIGRNADGFTFHDVERVVTDPTQAYFVPYSENPVIDGPNLYAASPVKVGATWYIYYGGYDIANEGQDDVYLRTTTDPTFRNLSAPTEIVSDGFYVHANDPSVVKNGPTWVMALSTAQSTDACSILTSTDGITWPALVDASAQVIWSGSTVTTCARPSLNFNSVTSTWEMYFDGTVNGVYSQFLATSTQSVPTTFTIEKNIAAWADADIKRLSNGTYVAAYRPITLADPWFIDYSTSSDGRNWTDRGRLLDPSPLTEYDNCGVTNPGWAIDGSTFNGLFFGGTLSCGKDSHKIGIAYPQAAVQPFSGTQPHNYREATSPSTQRVETFSFNQISRIVVTERPAGPSVIDYTTPQPSNKSDSWSVASRALGGILSSAAASSSATPPHSASLARDGDNSTFFSSSGGPAARSETFTLDLGNVTTARGLLVIPRAGGYGFPIDYAIQYSADGSAWTTIPHQSYTNVGNPGSTPITHAFDEPVTARYLRISATRQGSDNFGNPYLQFAEVQAVN